MIVQPASLDPRSRPRRVLRIVGLVVPVVALVAIAGVGVLGPTSDAGATRGTPPPAAAQVAIGDPSPSEAVPPAGKVAVFPDRIAGLQVDGVQRTLEARSRGLGRGGVIAIAGYLALDDQPSDCVGAGGIGVVVPFCDRTGILAEDPWAAGDRAGTRPPPHHVHLQIPPGVRVPYLAASAARLGMPSPPVVVLARFDDPRAIPCMPAGRHCGMELVAERISWIDGEAFPRTVTVDPRVSVGGRPSEDIRRDAAWAVSSLEPGGYPLLAVLVTPETLAGIDPEAANGLPAEGPLWYVRGLHRAGDAERIDWFVVDAERQETLTSGSITMTAPGNPGSP